MEKQKCVECVKYKVFFTGTPNCGLGNILFKLSSAIYYVEKYGYELVLDNQSMELYTGSSINEDRTKIKIVNNDIMTYNNTIFSKLVYDNIEQYKNDCITIHNNYTCHQLNVEELIEKKHIFIEGYCQNFHLFFEYMNVIPNYLNFENDMTTNILVNKYNIDLSIKNIMVGMRLCKDFAHMKKITNMSYKNALERIIQTFETPETPYNLIIISDTLKGVNEKLDFKINGNIIYIEEDDVTQFQIGLLCNYFVLCESTFHYWIALMKEMINGKNNVEPPMVVCFKDTDLTNRPIALSHWITV